MFTFCPSSEGLGLTLIASTGVVAAFVQLNNRAPCKVLRIATPIIRTVTDKNARLIRALESFLIWLVPLSARRTSAAQHYHSRTRTYPRAYVGLLTWRTTRVR